jgi:amino acid adenylation domain-containing protein/non-ribosomal peptide synthase protein (TIGR01720 family)
VGEWLAELLARQVEMQGYEYSPLSRVQSWSGLSAGEALFESLVVFENYPLSESVTEGIEGLRIADVDLFDRTQYGLTLDVEPGGDLRVLMTYDGSRYESASMDRLGGHLSALLAGLAQGESEGDRVEALPWLPSWERQAMVCEWNGTSAPWDLSASVLEVVRGVVERGGEQAAVADGLRSWSYGELWERSGAVASALGELPAEGVVGVLCERGAELLAAMLGIWRAGGAYLPLDPQHPPARLSRVLERSGAVSVLVGEGYVGVLGAAVEPLAAEPRVLSLSSSVAWPSRAGRREAPLSPQRLAYVIFTSGSTGEPKGAMVDHRGMLNHLWVKVEDLGLSSSDGVAQTASQCFDISLWQYLSPLVVGGRVEVLDESTVRDPQAFASALSDRRVTVAEVVPSFLRLLLEELEELEGGGAVEGLLSLRWLIATGEALPPELARRWWARCGGVGLLNAYGPTECSDDVTHWRVVAADGESSRVPIGRAVGNLRLYVLGRGGEELGLGMTGELWVGGVGVGRGYLGDGVQTARSFVPDPYGEPGARLYRTGDLGRRLADGRLEYLGRIDHQVKVRGYRIELGEIESHLAREAGVRAGVVAVRGDRLVGYVVAGEGWGGAESLRESLGRGLPEYMVPGVWVELSELPLSATGKVDRRRLPEPEWREPEREVVGPRSAAETLLAGIWSEVLGVERVGIHDDFFALGGDSILSIQIVSRARRAGLGLTPRQVFERPTIAQLAAVAGETVVVAEAEEPGRTPLLPVQRWFFAQGLAHPEHWNLGLLLASGKEPAELEPSALGSALRDVVERHEALRLRFVREGESWWQEPSPAAAWPGLAVIDLSGLAASRGWRELERAGAGLQGSLDPGSGRLLRAARFDLGSTSRLLLAGHHLGLDGVSWRIVLEDLETAYVARRAGESPSLARTTGYRTWSRRLESYGRTAAVASQLEYWLEQVEGRTGRLPAERLGGASGADVEGSARRVVVELSREETSSLLQQVPRAYRTRIDESLLTALAEGLAAFTGERSLRVLLESHGREEELVEGVDLSRTVGWFTSEYPLRLVLSPGGGPGEDLKAIKEQLRRVPAKGLGYGLLRYGGGAAAERLAAGAEPEVLFNYLGQVDRGLGESPWLAPAAESAGAPSHPANRRGHRLEVNGQVREGRLELLFGYSETLDRRETVEGMAAAVVSALRGLIAHCASPEAGGYTPSDFPLAGLSQARLDRLFADRAGSCAVEDLYPLSPMQQGMLFHSLYAEGDDSYVNHLTCTLAGDLDVAAFRRAWQRVSQRHTILRTAFLWRDLDRPLQLVEGEVAVPLVELDWRDLPAAERGGRLASRLAEEKARGFAIESAPLIRFLLIRFGEREHRLVWIDHHLILDGWSITLLFRELFALYEAGRRGRDLPLPPAPPYRRLIAWLGAQDLGEAEAYWRTRLAGFAQPTPLPAEGEIGAPVGGETGAEERREMLGPEDTEAVQRFAREHGLTLNTVVQGAWSLLLAQASGRRDVVYGCVVSGRPPSLPEVESAIGLFINNLPMRVAVEPATALLPWLRGLQEQLVDLRRYEHVRLVDVQGWSGVPRHLPLFESVVAFENFPMDAGLEERLPDLEVRDFARAVRNSYPLTLRAVPWRQLVLDVLYDASRFDRRHISRLQEGLMTLLRRMAERPESTLGELIGVLEQAASERRLQEAGDYAAAVRRRLGRIGRRETVERQDWSASE